MRDHQVPLVLLQTSDWHVGSPLTGRGLKWPPELRSARRVEVDGVAQRAVDAARTAEADALLIPGDLWDAQTVSPSVIHSLLEALESFAPRPVFIAPGNHDFAGLGGWYDPAVLSSLGMRSWPENVFIFRDHDWAALPFPGREDVTVLGRAFLSPSVDVERPLSRPPGRPETPLAILLLHGSLESYSGPDRPTGSKRTAPFSREELLAAGFTWTALGHHHQAQLVEDDSGFVRGGYSGCPTGRGLDERGPRVFLKVTLGLGEGPRVDTVPADSRTIHDLSIEVSDLEAGAIRDRMAAALDQSGAGRDDIVRVTLTGRQVYGARPAAALEALGSRVAHLFLRDETSAASETEPDPRTAEGRFLLDLTARREKAPDEAARRVIDTALALGRDALAGRVLIPPRLEDS